MIRQYLDARSSFDVPNASGAVPRASDDLFGQSLADGVDSGRVSGVRLHDVAFEVDLEHLAVLAPCEEPVPSDRGCNGVHEVIMMHEFILELIFASRIIQDEQLGRLVYRTTQQVPTVKGRQRTHGT